MGDNEEKDQGTGTSRGGELNRAANKEEENEKEKGSEGNIKERQFGVLGKKRTNATKGDKGRVGARKSRTQGIHRVGKAKRKQKTTTATARITIAPTIPTATAAAAAAAAATAATAATAT